MNAQNNQMVNPSSNVVYVTTDSIQSNPTKLGIYQKPENFDLIKENIAQMGVLVPLIVDVSNNEIISGNLRHQIAVELGHENIPVIFEEVKGAYNADTIAISTNQFRQKSSLEILNEIKFLESRFPVKKGQRADLYPEAKETKEKRDELLSKVGKDKIIKLKSIDRYASDLYGNGTKEYFRVLNSLDNGGKSLNKLDKELKQKVRAKQHNVSIPTKYDFKTNGVTIHCGSSSEMTLIEDNSIQTIITSPPYFKMRDYNTGKKQLGLESSVEEYLNNMAIIFKEAFRVLKSDGSLFVNINDCCIDGQYQAVPQKFVLKMLELGFLFNDELIWVKNNAQYTHGNRSVRNHEPIFHFVKSKKFYYDTSWMDNLVDKNNAVSYGTNASFPKLFSGLDYVLNDVIRGNASSTSDLRKKCKEQGFYLTHSATFPLSIPAICILMSSKEGDTVLDCFNGTATTGEAAIRLGRKYIGYETNPEYVMASEVRINSIENQELLLAA
jgi:site-specific DNA-methyltransferase (adenine-specific)